MNDLNKDSHWLTMKCSMLSLVRLVFLSRCTVPLRTSSCSDIRSFRDKISSCMHCSYKHKELCLMKICDRSSVKWKHRMLCFSHLLQIVDGWIRAGKSCSPEHLQQSCCLLQDLSQSLGVQQKALYSSVVQNLEGDLS